MHIKGCDHLWWPTDNTLDEQSGEKHYTLQSFVEHIQEVAISEMSERCRQKKLRREEKMVTIFGDQQKTLLMNKVVRNTIRFKAS